MKRKLLPRLFRLVGRVSLAAGAILGVGMGTLMVYGLVAPGQFGGGGVIVEPIEPPAASEPSIRTSHLIWLALMLGLIIVGLVITIRQLNNFMRKTIARIAGFLKWEIFGTEIALGSLVWGVCAALSLFWLPAGAIVAAAFLVFTEICFVLAWLIYKRPRYKI